MSLIVEKILEILQDRIETSVNIFTEIADIYGSRYSFSYRRARRFILEGERTHFSFSSDRAATYRDRQKLYSILNRLKRQGLVEKRGTPKLTRWKITPLGRKRLAILRKKSTFTAALKKSSRNVGKFIIVIFDIPETERHQRAWLRWALEILDFSMLQKSVWIGTRRIPEEFLEKLKERRLLDYVHIFEISRAGTIKEIA